MQSRGEGTTNTWKLKTDLDMIFAHRVPHEHGVEGGDLVHSHPRHPDHLGHVMHARDGQPASVLPLGQVKQGDNLNNE